MINHIKCAVNGSSGPQWRVPLLLAHHEGRGLAPPLAPHPRVQPVTVPLVTEKTQAQRPSAEDARRLQGCRLCLLDKPLPGHCPLSTGPAPRPPPSPPDCCGSHPLPCPTERPARAPAASGRRQGVQPGPWPQTPSNLCSQ